MSRVLVRPSAREDLRAIVTYVAERNPQAARRLFGRVVASCRLFATVPLAGRQRPDLGPGLRSFVVSPYLAIYRPIEDGIELIRVIHGRRDLKAQFRGT